MKKLRSLLALVYAVVTAPAWILLCAVSIAALSTLDAWTWLGYRILGTRAK